MAKLAQTSVKYMINIEFTADGMVEKPDVIGAIFGQTEGLLGQDLDLRELQRTGRIGRIEVDIKPRKGGVEGEIMIPSSLDSTETALVAATIETIDRVGPCEAKMRVKSIEDVRSLKRTYIRKRAEELLRQLISSMPEASSLAEELKEALRMAEITTYKGLPAGPEVATSGEIILVEGRADVINLLRHGIKNALAIGGTSIPPVISEISREKEVTAFLDGDRGGDLILKELKQMAEIDFVARSPKGKEVEELTKKEVFKALREKVPVEQAKYVSRIEEDTPQPVVTVPTPVEAYTPEEPDREEPQQEKRTRERDQKRDRQRQALPPEEKEQYKKYLDELVGTKAASIFDEKGEFAGRVPVKELPNAIKQVPSVSLVVVDGHVDAKTMDAIKRSGAKVLVCHSFEGRRPLKMKVYTEEDLS